MSLLTAAEKREQLDEECDPLNEQIKRKLTKRINSAPKVPFEFTHPLLAHQLEFSSSIDDWLREHGYGCSATSNIVRIYYK